MSRTKEMIEAEIAVLKKELDVLWWQEFSREKTKEREEALAYFATLSPGQTLAFAWDDDYQGRQTDKGVLLDVLPDGLVNPDGSRTSYRPMVSIQSEKYQRVRYYHVDEIVR